MVEKIITEILQSATEYLTTDQLDKLQGTLFIKMHGYDVVETCTDLVVSEDGNMKLMNLFLATKRVEGRSENTLMYYRSTLSKALEFLNKQIKDINTNDLRYYLAIYKQERKVSNVTVDNVRRIFTSFFGWLAEEDHIAKSPAKRLKRTKVEQRVKEALNEEEMERIRCQCKRERDLAIIDFLYSTGVRVSELVSLNRSDIDFAAKECIVFGKGAKERRVYLNAKALIHLKSYLGSRTDDNPALFVSCKEPHSRLSAGGIESIVRELGEKAHVKKVHPHRYRRTMATSAMNRGMPIQEVSVLLGHQQIETTMIYCVVNQNNVKLSHQRYL